MLTWERNVCPNCSLVWERNLDGAWRYIARIAVPLPEERACPVCQSKLHLRWIRPVPVLPSTERQ